jgi:predicted PurR-regulated permease PerM
MEINTNQQIHPNVIRQLMLLALVIGLGYLLYSEMAFMVGAFLGAVALYMLMRKPMFKMAYEWKVKKWAASLILILVSLVVIVLPFAFIINILINKLVPLITDPRMITGTLNKIDQFVHTKFHINLLSNTNLEKLPGIATNLGGKILGGTLSMVLNVLIMYFILWFMLMKGKEMESTVRKRLPLKNANVDKILREAKGMVVSNSVGIPVLAVFQGFLAALGYYFFGVDEPILWGIVTGIASFVPFVGTTLIWLPISLLAFAKGDSTHGWWLLLWGVVIIGSMDNVIRFILQKYMADVHPLITVFGVIIGLNLFGFLGLIFGPLLISLFLLLVRIYNDEFISPRPVELSVEIPGDKKGDENNNSDK